MESALVLDWTKIRTMMNFFQWNKILLKFSISIKLNARFG